MSKWSLVLAVTCGAALGWAGPVSAQVSPFPIRPGSTRPPSPPPLGLTGSGPIFLLGPGDLQQRREQAAQVRSGLATLRQGQVEIEQRLNQLSEQDPDAYLLRNDTLLGRRAATFNDTRGAFPDIDGGRPGALGPRPGPRRPGRP